MTFNHGVEGSSPSALTIDFKGIFGNLALLTRRRKADRVTDGVTICDRRRRFSDGEAVMEIALLILALVVSVYVALRWTLRSYFPPDT